MFLNCKVSEKPSSAFILFWEQPGVQTHLTNPHLTNPGQSRWKEERSPNLTSCFAAWFMWQQMTVTVLSLSLSLSLSLYLALSFHINTHTLIHDKAMPADTGQLWAADVPHCLRPQPCIHIRVKLWVIARHERPRSPLQAQLLIMQCQFNAHTWFRFANTLVLMILHALWLKIVSPLSGPVSDLLPPLQPPYWVDLSFSDQAMQAEC